MACYEKIRRKLHKNQDGYAIVFALTALLVITIACMSIFLAASSSMKNAIKERDRAQARVLALTLANEVIAEEINEVPETGIDQLEEGSLAAYLYDHIAMRTDETMKDWNWYNDDEDFRTKEASARTFDLDASALGEKNISAKVSMYWESNVDDENINKDYSDRKLTITTSVTYKGKAGDETAKVTSVYECYTLDPTDSGAVCQYYWKKEE